MRHKRNLISHCLDGAGKDRIPLAGAPGLCPDMPKKEPTKASNDDKCLVVVKVTANFGEKSHKSTHIISRVTHGTEQYTQLEVTFRQSFHFICRVTHGREQYTQHGNNESIIY